MMRLQGRPKLQTLLGFCLVLLIVLPFLPFLPEEKIDRSVETSGENVQLRAWESSAMIFFESFGETLHLSVMITEDSEPEDIYRTSIYLEDGHSHSMVVGRGAGAAGADKFEFSREADTVFARAKRVRER